MSDKKGGLVLTRKPGQNIIITNSETGDKIIVRMVDIWGLQGKIGIAASDKYTIHREEIQKKIDMEEKNERF